MTVNLQVFIESLIKLRLSRVIANSVEQHSIVLLEVRQHIEEFRTCKEDRGLQLLGLGIKHCPVVLICSMPICDDPENNIPSWSLSLVAAVVDFIHLEAHILLANPFQLLEAVDTIECIAG